MSVPSAAASVGMEIIKTRVEIPAMETPMTEFTSVNLRSRSLVWDESCTSDVASLPAKLNSR